MPWKLLATPGGYIFTWLVGYSALLGPIAGILIADYYLIRKTRLDLGGLYGVNPAYQYRGGFNPAAMIALIVAIIVFSASRFSAIRAALAARCCFSSARCWR